MTITTPPTVAPNLRARTDVIHAVDWARHHQQPLFMAGVALVIVAFVVAEWQRQRTRTINRSMAPVAIAIHKPVTICHWFLGIKAVRFRNAGVSDITYMKLKYGDDAIDYAHNPAIQHLYADLAERMGGPVSIFWGRRKGVVTIRLIGAPEPVVDLSGKVVRAQKLARRLLGEGAQVESSTLNLDGSIEAFAITHDDIHDAKPEFRKDIDNTIQAKLGQRLQSQWDEAHDRVIYRSVPDLPVKVPHVIDGPRTGYKIPFAEANGKTVEWDLDSALPHAMVAGGTGGGKTSTIRTLITGALPLGAEVRICDAKRVSFMDFETWPGVTSLSTEIDEIIATILATRADLEDRYLAIKRRELTEDDLTPIILVIDEITETLSQIRKAHKAAGGTGEAPAVEEFGSLLRLGRQGRVHLAIGVQRPDAKIIGGEERSNIGFRILAGRGRTQTLQMLEFTKNVTSKVRGRAVVDVGDGEFEAQVFWTPDVSKYKKLSPDDRAIIDGLRPAPAVRTIYPDRPVTPQPVAAPQTVAAPQLRVVTAEPDEPEPEREAAPAPPATRHCTACDRPHPVTDFGNSGSRCRESERLRQAAIRAARRVPSV